MIYYIISLWIAVALAALVPLLLAAWRSRRFWHRPGMPFILAILIGGALDNGLAVAVAIGALPDVSPDTRVTAASVVLTIGRLAASLPAIAFALYMLGLFSGGQAKDGV